MAASLSQVSAVLGAVVVYTGCVLLFQSGARRERHKAVRVPQAQRPIAKVFGWVFVLGSLFLFSIPQGIERGVPVWLGALALSGIASLLVSALVPRFHLKSILGVIGLIAALAFTYSMAGSAG